MRVIFTHDVTDDAARFAVRPPGDIARFLAGVENAAVDRLQTVAHVGQRAADDHRHGVIEVAGLHLLDDGDGGNIAVLMFVGGRLGRQKFFLSCLMFLNAGNRSLDRERAPIRR